MMKEAKDSIEKSKKATRAGRIASRESYLHGQKIERQAAHISRLEESCSGTGRTNKIVFREVREYQAQYKELCDRNERTGHALLACQAENQMLKMMLHQARRELATVIDAMENLNRMHVAQQ